MTVSKDYQVLFFTVFLNHSKHMDNNCLCLIYRETSARKDDMSTK